MSTSVLGWQLSTMFYAIRGKYWHAGLAYATRNLDPVLVMKLLHVPPVFGSSQSKYFCLRS